MADENTYANFPSTTNQNRVSEVQEDPQRWSKLKRAAPLVVTVLLLAAVVVGVRVIMYFSDSPPRNNETMTEMTTVSATTQQETTTVQPCVDQCDPGWELNGTKCYNFSSNRLKWTESRDMCESLSGHLVKIESREEQTFLFSQLIEGDRFWIGLTDSEIEGQWNWTDGSPLDQSLTFWNQNPDNFIPNDSPEGEDCAIILLQPGLSVDRSWVDLPCGFSYRFICEKETICK